MHYLDDLTPGLTFDLGNILVTRDAMLDFSRQFDPQAFHLDDAVGDKLFGGLIASGWHTVSLGQRLMVDNFLSKVACQASPGVDTLRFLKPVFAEVTLSGTLEVMEARPSAAKPNLGIAKLLIELRNQKGEPVLSMVGKVMVARAKAP